MSSSPHTSGILAALARAGWAVFARPMQGGRGRAPRRWLRPTFDKGLGALGIFAAVGSASFAAYMINADNSHPRFVGGEHFMLFAQPFHAPAEPPTRLADARVGPGGRLRADRNDRAWSGGADQGGASQNARGAPRRASAHRSRGSSCAGSATAGPSSTGRADPIGSRWARRCPKPAESSQSNCVPASGSSRQMPELSRNGTEAYRPAA